MIDRQPRHQTSSSSCASPWWTRGIYRGPLVNLQGKTALVKTESIGTGRVKVQFDDFTATMADPARPARVVQLAGGWHEFAESEWEIEKRPN